MTRRIRTFAASTTLAAAIVVCQLDVGSALAAPSRDLRPHVVDRVITKSIRAFGELEHPGGSLTNALASYRTAAGSLEAAADLTRKAGLPSTTARHTSKRLKALAEDLTDLADCFESAMSTGNVQACLKGQGLLQNDAYKAGFVVGKLARYATLTPTQIQKRLLAAL